MAKSEGLGDSINKLTTKTGIKKVVKFLAGDDCGCTERMDRLNEIFKYKRNEPKCLTELEYLWLKNYFENPSKFSYVVIKTKIGTIWARVFGMHYKKICGSCNEGRQLIRYTDELKKVYKTYEV